MERGQRLPGDPPGQGDREWVIGWRSQRMLGEIHWMVELIGSVPKIRGRSRILLGG